MTTPEITLTKTNQPGEDARYTTPDGYTVDLASVGARWFVSRPGQSFRSGGRGNARSLDHARNRIRMERAQAARRAEMTNSGAMTVTTTTPTQIIPDPEILDTVWFYPGAHHAKRNHHYAKHARPVGTARTLCGKAHNGEGMTVVHTAGVLGPVPVDCAACLKKMV